MQISFRLYLLFNQIVLKISPMLNLPLSIAIPFRPLATTGRVRKPLVLFGIACCVFMTPSLSAAKTAAKTATNGSSFVLSDPGTEKIIDYEKYGTFISTGSPQYSYKITDRPGLNQAA